MLKTKILQSVKKALVFCTNIYMNTTLTLFIYSNILVKINSRHNLLFFVEILVKDLLQIYFKFYNCNNVTYFNVKDIILHVTLSLKIIEHRVINKTLTDAIYTSSTICYIIILPLVTSQSTHLS